MSRWPAVKAKRVLAALLRIVWSIGWPDFVFAFHDDEELGPRMLARIAKATGLRADDL